MNYHSESLTSVDEQIQNYLLRFSHPPADHGDRQAVMIDRFEQIYSDQMSAIDRQIDSVNAAQNELTNQYNRLVAIRKQNDDYYQQQIQQRIKLQGILELKDRDLTMLEQRNNELAGMVIEDRTQQLTELVDGVQICSEKLELLKEENQDYIKQLSQATHQNEVLQRNYKMIKCKHQEQSQQHQLLESIGQTQSEKAKKKLKVITNLRSFIVNNKQDAFKQQQQVQGGQQSIIRKSKFKCGQPTLEDIAYLEESLQRFDALKVSVDENSSPYLGALENDVAESINQLINIKSQLSIINQQDIDDQSSHQVDQQANRSNLRYSTHYDLGPSKDKSLDVQQQPKVQFELFKAYTEQDEEYENEQSSKQQGQGDFKNSTGYDYVEESDSPIKIQLYRSAHVTSKGHDKQWDCNMESGKKQKLIKSVNSFASFSSQSSNRLGAPTLRDELFSMQIKESSSVVELQSDKSEELGDLVMPYNSDRKHLQKQNILNLKSNIKLKNKQILKEPNQHNTHSSFKSRCLQLLGVGIGSLLLFQAYKHYK